MLRAGLTGAGPEHGGEGGRRGHQPQARVFLGAQIPTAECCGSPTALPIGGYLGKPRPSHCGPQRKKGILLHEKEGNVTLNQDATLVAMKMGEGL
jgi:hypothetical protein